MGYGGGDAAMGRVTGRSGDGGIDGTIREDPFGLDRVHVQAKKYAKGNNVGEGDLRNFAGAIDVAGNKGIFVTTSGFTQATRDYVKRSTKQIILIDGEELARLMVRHGIGACGRGFVTRSSGLTKTTSIRRCHRTRPCTRAEPCQQRPHT